jgi:hypothetical protein
MMINGIDYQWIAAEYLETHQNVHLRTEYLVFQVSVYALYIRFK